MDLVIKRDGFQHQLLKSDAPLLASITGYGAGKTFIGTLKAILLSKENAPCMGLVVCSSWELLSTTVVPQFYEHLDRMNIQYIYKEQKGILVLPWCKIILRVATKPIVGMSVGWAYCDEAALYPDRTFKDILARVRDKRAKNMQIVFTSTPEGRTGWLYRNFHEKPLPDSVVIHGSTRENIHNHEDYVERLQSAYSDQEIRGYLEGEWVDYNAMPAYHAFDEKCIVDNWPLKTAFGNYNLMQLEQGLPIIVGFDFGNFIATCVIAQKSEAASRIYLRFIDEIFLHKASTWDLCHELIKRYGGQGLQLIVTGDATGGHMRGSAAEKTDYDVVRQLCTPHFNNVNIKIPNSNTRVVDRIETTNSALKGSKHFHLRIHPRCKMLIRDFREVSYIQDGSRRLDKNTNKELTHISDAAGYLLQQMRTPLKEFKKLRVWS